MFMYFANREKKVADNMMAISLSPSQLTPSNALSHISSATVLSNLLFESLKSYVEDTDVLLHLCNAYKVY
jgi:hypothetical protein